MTENGRLYVKLDCLDILETLEDNMFSLIYFDIPTSIGTESKRIEWNKIDKDLVEAMKRINKGETEQLSNSEIEAIKKAYDREINALYCEYLFKVTVNCFRVLKKDGIIIYRESALSRYGDMRYMLDVLFSRFGTRAMEFSLGFDSLHFYRKGNYISFPRKKGLPLERFQYEDARGKYMLVPVEFSWRKSGNINCLGYYDTAKKKWVKEPKIANHLYEKGDIILLKDKQGNLVPKLKYYRDEHKVKVPYMWNSKNVFENSFDIFTLKGDKVLSLCEKYQFAPFAEKKGLIWYSVLPELWDIQKPKKKYTIVESLGDCGIKEYKMVAAMEEFVKVKEKFFSDVVIECKLKEQPHLEAGNTTDEILYYYMLEYIKKEAITVSKSVNNDETMRQNFYKIQNSAKGKRKASNRSRAVILRIAVLTGMPIADIKRALALSGVAFDDKDNVADKTFTEWYIGGGTDINEYDGVLKEKCRAVNWTQSQIDEYMIQIKSERNTKEKMK